MSIVIQTSFLGDMVLTTPLIAELATRGVVDVVATPASAPLLANNPGVRDVIVFDKRGAGRGVGGVRALARELRGRRGDEEGGTAYLAQGSWRSAAVARLAGFRNRVGFDTSAGRRLYTKRVPYREDRHHAERLWRLGAPTDDVEPTSAQLRPRLYPGDAERSAVTALLSGAEPLVALAPGSVWATKRWPYYAELAGALSALGRIVIVGGSADTPLASAIMAAAPGAIDATGRLSLLASAELISRTKVLVTNDSSPQHLASAMGTPAITIFGPTVPDFGFGPLAPRSTTVGHESLACRPCDRHGPTRCPLGHWRCMRELSVESVATRVRALVG